MLMIFLGPPGGGKGTQSVEIEKRYGMVQLSTGDMLRAEIKSGSELGVKLKKTIDSGALVADELIISMVKANVDKYLEKGVIFDGFPRTTAQAEALDGMLNQKSLSIDAVVELDVDRELIVDRIINRFSCKDCGANYNKKFNPTTEENICNSCGSSDFSYRSDDNEQAVASRLNVYYEQTAPLLAYYKKQGKLTTVNGMQQLDEVSKDIFSILDDLQDK